MDTQKLARLIRLIVIKQWFHSIFALVLVNTNRPEGLGCSDPEYVAANQIQDIAWRQYCSIGDQIRELTKDTDLAKFCF